MATTFDSLQRLGISERGIESSKVVESQIQSVLYKELIERVAMKLEAFLMMNLEPRVSANRLKSLQGEVRKKAVSIIIEWEEKTQDNREVLIAMLQEIDVSPRIPRNSLLRDSLYEKAYEVVPFQK